MSIKDNTRIINAWAMYDWANSVYALVITSTIFPIYYAKITASDAGDKIWFWGMEFVNTALYTYTLSFSFLVIVLFVPILSGIADYSGRKKFFMQCFCYLGAGGCVSLYFFDGNSLGLGLLSFVVASIGYTGSFVFYNAYLPEIASPARQDAVSARGFSLGYAGSSLLLILNIFMIREPQFFGLSTPMEAMRWSFLLTGLWWAGFAQITFYHLPKTVHRRRDTTNIFLAGYRELRHVVRQLPGLRYLACFLAAFFFFMMGVQTVMYVATLFGEKELRLSASTLIITILIIQFVAIGGAYIFSWLSSRIGNLPALQVAVTIWMAICVGAYFVYEATGFYMLAFCVGMVMGGIQSLSRSTYTKLLPDTKDNASFFSFYDITEKVGIILGTASFGMMEELTGSMRNSIFALVSYFLIGLLLLILVRHFKPDAGNPALLRKT